MSFLTLSICILIFSFSVRCSHDQHLLTSVCQNIYVVENGGLEELREGNNAEEAFQAYKRAIVLGRR